MADTVLKLVRGNDSDMSVCIQRREGSGEPVPYDLSGAEDVRLSLTGHGIHVFAKNVSVTGASSNIITGRMTGRMLLGVYDLEVTFTLGGMAKRFSIPDLAEVVDHLEDDSDGVAEGEGDGIVVTLIIQPEIIEVAGITRDELNAGLALKVDKVPGKGLSANDYTDGEKEKLGNLPTAETLAEDLDDKVDKVPGKGLSESDFTSGEKTKLAGIAAGAQVNVIETVKVGGAALDVVAKAVNIPVDSAPTAGSGNLATSGGIHAAIKAVRDALALIEAVVPTQASADNELADKEFVNSSISTSTAEFRGTVNSVAELPTTGVDDNDYAFVVSTDSAGNTVYNRYKFTPSNGWIFEYALNNSSFTSEQWAAIQSGMTAALVTKLKALPTAAALETSLGLKVDKVTGKGLSTNDYSDTEKAKLGALPSASDLSTSLAGKVDKIVGKGLSTEDYTTTEKDKLAGIEEGAQVNLPVDEEPTEGSTNPVSSGGMHAILTPVEEAGAEFVERVAPVNGKTSLGVTRVKGRTLAWNQLCSDGPKSVAGAGESFPEKIPSGHKILISYLVMKSTDFQNTGRIGLTLANGGDTYGGNLFCYDTPSDGSYHLVRGVVLNGNDSNQNYYYRMDISSGTMIIKDAMAIDLTRIFGAGNEPTVAEFEAMFPEDYYDYTAGELVNVAASGVKTVGFNQWDEEWELEGSRMKSKTLIPLLPNTAYYITMLSFPGHYHNKIFFNSEGKQISLDTSDSQSFITPADCAFMSFMLAASYGTTYKHDICINISDPDRNGEYEPYKEDVVPLGLDSSKVKDSEGNILEIKGLASAGGTYDEKTCAKLAWRVGRIDLGSLNWTYYGEYFVAPNSFGAAHTTADIICPLYKPAVYSSQMTDKSVHIDSDGQIYIKDSSYNDAASFKAAMSGVMLNYKLATPIEYDLAEPRAWVAEREDGGTETIIQTGSSAPVILAPVLDLKYGDYAKEIAPFLKSDLASAESVKAMLEAMKTAGVISAYTMTWNKSARRYDFTISQ